MTNALAYLTASKNGLSNVEMEDVLSLDEFVLNDVFQHWLPPIRRIPPLLLPRLHDELSSYIMQREANGAVVYYWWVWSSAIGRYWVRSGSLGQVK